MSIATVSLKTMLRKLGACSESVEWVGSMELAEAWQKCERADWMLWLCGKMIGNDGWPTRQQVVLVACILAEDVLPVYEKKYPKDERVRRCIKVTRQWANGLATIEEVRLARAAAYAAAYAAYAAAAAAAYAAADAAAAAAYAAYAAYAAAADAAAAYAADAAAADGQNKFKQYADIIRKELRIGEFPR
jgi:hypothetical protein